MIDQTISIRPAELADVEAMATTAVDAWRFAYSDFLPTKMMDEWADVDRFVNRFKNNWHQENDRLVACDRNGTVLGFAVQRQPCNLAGFDAEIAGLYVSPTANRRGIGKLLVLAMVTRFLKSGHRSMAIHTLAENKIGCAFYEKMGGTGHSFSDWDGVQGKWYVWPDLTLFRN